jgi:hypothetical protein
VKVGVREDEVTRRGSGGRAISGGKAISMVCSVAYWRWKRVERGGALRVRDGFFGGEGAKGEEGVPEAAFGGGVFQGRGERGKPEAGGPLCPVEPGAFRALREQRSGERVV